MEVVINKCYGGFGLSFKAVMRYAELKGFTLYPYTSDYRGDKPVFTPYTGGDAFCISYNKFPIENDKLSNDGFFSEGDIERHDPDLVKVIKEMGADANDKYSKLEIVVIPDDVDYCIEEYDGIEWVTDKNRRWE